MRIHFIYTYTCINTHICIRSQLDGVNGCHGQGGFVYDNGDVYEGSVSILCTDARTKVHRTCYACSNTQDLRAHIHVHPLCAHIFVETAYTHTCIRFCFASDFVQSNALEVFRILRGFHAKRVSC
jgi:hypothetical protein